MPINATNRRSLLIPLTICALTACGGSLELLDPASAGKGDGPAASTAATWGIGVSLVQVARVDPYGAAIDYDGDGALPTAPQLTLRLTVGDRSGGHTASAADYTLLATAHAEGRLVEALSTAQLTQPWHLELTDGRSGVLVASCSIAPSADELQRIAVQQGVIRRRASDCPNPNGSDPRRLELVELSVFESAPAVATDTAPAATPAPTDPAQAAQPAQPPTAPSTPRATFLSPQHGATVALAVEVAVAVTDEARTASVSLEVDGVRTFEWVSAPYTKLLTLQYGPHELKLVVTDSDGSVRETDLITINASASAQPTAPTGEAAMPATPATPYPPTGHVSSAAGCSLAGDAGDEPLPYCLGVLAVLALARRRRRR